MRVGHGYDVHPLEQGRALILGGVEVPFPKGLAGHSDGDVLIHAIIDALLGASGKGDIGTHFPSSEAKYEGVSSLDLLSETAEVLDSAGWKIINVDATIVAQEPKLSTYIPQMRERLARTLDVTENKVNVKAKTTDGLGFAGKGEGIAAYAVALVQEKE